MGSGDDSERTAAPRPDSGEDERTVVVPDSALDGATLGVDPESLGASAAGGELAGFSVGPFEIERELGRGGMGIVYLAKDLELGRRVALKVLPEGFGNTPELRARFRREAEVASRLDHPNLCGILRVGESEGRAWIAMRYVRGRTFDEVLREGGPAAEATAAQGRSRSAERHRGVLSIVEKIARAVHAAHEAGIVHRDLKPGNVMITAEGEPVLLDFGLAHDLAAAGGPALTQSGDVLGTPFYMAPEQIRGQLDRIDPRVDVWALGVMLHEAVVGARPFEGATRDALYRAILEQDPAPLRRRRSGLPRDLETIVATALQKNPDRRYASALALAEDLRALAEIRPIRARPATLLERGLKFARRRPATVTLVLIVLVVLPAVAGLAVSRAIDRGRLEEERGRARASAEQALLAERPRAAAAAVEALARLGEAPATLRSLRERQRQLADLEDAMTLLLDEDADPEGRRALELLEELTRRYPDAAEPRLWLALVLVREGRPDEARRILQGSGRLIPDSEVLETALVESGEALRALLDQRAADRGRALFGALALSVGGRPREALAALEALLERDPDAHWLAWAAAEQATRVQDFHAALAHAGRARALLGALSPLQKGRYSLHLRRAGLPLPALDLAEEAAREAPEEPLVLFHFASALADVGRLAEAEGAYLRALDLDPRLAVAWRNLASLQIEAGRHAEALESADAALALDDSEPGFWVNRAVALVALERDEEAAESYRRALDLRDDFPFAWNNYAAVLKDLGRLDEAEAAARRAVTSRTGYAEAWHNLGTILVRKRNLDEARAAFVRALDLDPRMAPSRSALATLDIAEGRLDEARRGYEAALEDDPRSELALSNLPLVCARLGDLAAARRYGNLALERRPRNAQGPLNLVSALIDAGDREAALEVLERTLLGAPEEGRIAMTLLPLLAERDTPAALAFGLLLRRTESPWLEHVGAFVPVLEEALQEVAPEAPLALAVAARSALGDGVEERAAALYARALEALAGEGEIPAVTEKRRLVVRWATEAELADLAASLGRSADELEDRSQARELSLARFLEPAVGDAAEGPVISTR